MHMHMHMRTPSQVLAAMGLLLLAVSAVSCLFVTPYQEARRSEARRHEDMGTRVMFPDIL